MAQIAQKIVPHIWLDQDAAAAAEFYVGIFKNSRILRTSYYAGAAEQISGQKKGTVMSVSIAIEGQKFIFLNGGPLFKPTEAISFVVYCSNQAEIDYFWEKLSFVPEAQQCG